MLSHLALSFVGLEKPFGVCSHLCKVSWWSESPPGVSSARGSAAGRRCQGRSPSPFSEGKLLLARTLLLKLKFGFHEGFYDANILSTTLKILPLKTVSRGSGPSRLQTTRGKRHKLLARTGRKQPKFLNQSWPWWMIWFQGSARIWLAFYSVLVVSGNKLITLVHVGMKWEQTLAWQPRQSWNEDWPWKPGILESGKALNLACGASKWICPAHALDLQRHFQAFFNVICTACLPSEPEELALWSKQPKR